MCWITTPNFTEGERWKGRRYLFCCSKCPAQYIEKNELRKHLQLHENSSEGSTKCEICGWLVRTRVLGRHKSDHHGKDSEKNKKSTTTQRNQKDFCIVERRSAPKNLKVSSCSRFTWTRHIQPKILHHRKKESRATNIVKLFLTPKWRETTTSLGFTIKGFSCELCGRSYYSGLRLNYHRRQVHYAELGLDPCQCPECGLILLTSKWFIDKRKPTRLGNQELPEGKHYRVEVGENQEKIWLCELCPVKFLAMSQVRKHLLSAHYYELKYICEGCGRRYCAAMGLHHHRKSCEGLKEGGTPGEKFTCDVCSKTFQTSDQRHQHERRRHESNSGGVPHLCPKLMKVGESCENASFAADAEHQRFEQMDEGLPLPLTESTQFGNTIEENEDDNSPPFPIRQDVTDPDDLHHTYSDTVGMTENDGNDGCSEDDIFNGTNAAVIVTNENAETDESTLIKIKEVAYSKRFVFVW
ncbi:putative zinc finger protein [Orchesella cincta]|uniref:Putative zinc finger protein n=1 Tax=Orchesella cincta TaxID=48709 RepID=A0A1D2M8F1_ORCCI|nr:putative zinc finger protein [Orchesella cincta]